MSDFADRTDAELRALAITRDIEDATTMTRAELVAALRGPASQDETTTEAEREENARTLVGRENDLAVQLAAPDDLI